MIERRELIGASVALPLLLAAGGANAQEPMPSSEAASEFVYRFVRLLKSGKYDEVGAYLAEDIRDLGGNDSAFSDPASAQAYLLEFGFPAHISFSNKFQLQENLIGALWSSSRFEGMPLLGPSWLFMFRLKFADPRDLNTIVIARMNVIEIANG